MLVRIVLQNLLLVGAVAMFTGLAIVGLVRPGSAWITASIHAVASGALLLQWCHHGVRTMQIKNFVVEQEAGQPGTWETWLPAHRPERLLGTRWLISTKGVFLGLQVAMMGLATALSGMTDHAAMIFCMVAFAGSLGLLFTNPKE
ncbi:hypothetical protein [Rubellimicrobium arenae]|uniref:hypothetical protein n=1 Tax=Rubellimicrobium arenae TaxID=2817372 RepID=UPI001B3038CB|nr:hypothetical protein [Rubellimicrobium arenae]